tara:strand:+ start:1497 stop:1889 length:393 start_codon:yes stop_codon:yes gene_type:complete
MEKKMTAVEWLVEEMINKKFFSSDTPLSFTTLEHLTNQAKQMEREQIEELESSLKLMNSIYNEDLAIKKELGKEVERLRGALNQIADPLKYMQNKAKEEGVDVNGIFLIELCKNAEFLKGMAIEALNPKQ